MNNKVDASGLAGGLIAAALLETLRNKGILTNAEAREVLNMALTAVGPDMGTPEGGAAADAIASLLRGKYTERMSGE